MDSQLYSQPATFVWPAGSKHILTFVTDPTQPNQMANTTVQTASDGQTQYVFSTWVDNANLIVPNTDPIQTITADPHITSISAKLSVAYRVFLNYFASADPTLPAVCGAPSAIPPGQFRPGIVFVGSQCFWASATIFVPANTTLNLNAFPYPGFVFLGWSNTLNGGDYLQTLVVHGPQQIVPHFSPAKRVQFVTSPPQLQVLVDRTTIPTRRNPDVTAPCTERQPLPPLTNFTPLCWGDFDFAAGSSHTISAINQLDVNGKSWVYDSWTSLQGQTGSGPSSVYTTDYNLSNPDTVTVKFIPGANVSFLTNPNGLKLTVDSRSNFPSYNFIWGLGTTHTVSAPPSQFDKNGRQYTFQSWSNTSGASQTVTVDQSAVTNGLRLVANYGVLSRVIVQSSPTGLSVQVDGSTCRTPCTLDRASGAQLHVTAPSTVSLGDNARLDLVSWSDGGASNHTFQVNADTTTLFANYRTSYRLITAADPGNGVTFQVDPGSSDGFYPQDTQVTISATPNPGFKFRRWGNDLSGTYPSGMLTMSVPHSVVALLDRVPYIAPAGIRNAVGDTPVSAVAAGSIITIFGQSLAPALEIGRVNPLAQSIAGVTVTVNDRILPLLYVSPDQLNAQIPSDLPPGDYTLLVHSKGQPDVSGTFTVVRDAPGIFPMMVNAQQYALAMHADGSSVTPDSPAQAGETLSVLGTGFGPYKAPVVDGFFPSDPPPALADSVSIAIGDQTIAPTFVGAAPGFSGVTLTQFKVPDGLPGGTTVPVIVSVNGVPSNTVGLPLQ